MEVAKKNEGATKRKFDKKGDSGHQSKKPKQTEKELSSSAQKRELRKERQSHRRHADVVAEAKEIWNDLREKKANSMEANDLMTKLMSLIRGKVPEIALQHDASRVVQAAVQYGTPEQRKELLLEICNSDSEGSMTTLPELSKIQYAHFCALKFIKYCARDDDCVRMIVKSFRGNMAKLAVHAIAARVVESIFLNLPARLTVTLKQELYGPHFGLFSSDIVPPKKNDSSSITPTLKSNIEAPTTTAQHAKSAKVFVKDIISKGMAKSLFGYTYFQNLLAEFVDVCDASEIRESVMPSVVDNALHLIATRGGTRVVAVCASYGTPKDRKRLLRSFKGYTRSSLLHPDAYMAILRIVQVTDDTVSVFKSLLNELLTAPADESKSVATIDGVKKVGKSVNKNDSTLLDVALDGSGSKLFLLLLGGDETTGRDSEGGDESKATNRCWKYFDPYERSILEDETPTITENGKSEPTCKKDPAVRRAELLTHLRVPLVELCTKHTLELLQSLPGSRVLKEVYIAEFERESLCNALLDIASGGSSSDLFEHPIAHRSIKNIILCDAASASSPCFSEVFFEKCSEQLGSIATGSNRGAFVVAALLKVASVEDRVRKALKQHKDQLEKLGNEKKKGPAAGFAALAKELS